MGEFKVAAGVIVHPREVSPASKHWLRPPRAKRSDDEIRPLAPAPQHLLWLMVVALWEAVFSELANGVEHQAANLK
jgi:hypothetical protein